MIDVIFFLLVFFMISSMAMTKINSLPVALPKTSSSPEALKQNIILTIKRTGQVFINQSPAPLESLGTQLSYEMHDRPQDVVVINADEGRQLRTGCKSNGSSEKNRGEEVCIGNGSLLNPI
jgi:biopolymer transport protein ExbD